MEKQYEHPTGLAAAVTGAIVYVLCAVVVKLWPRQALAFFGTWFHKVDLNKIAVAPQITSGDFMVGLIGTVMLLYVIGFVYAWVYNHCVVHCKQKKWI